MSIGNTAFGAVVAMGVDRELVSFIPSENGCEETGSTIRTKLRRDDQGHQEVTKTVRPRDFCPLFSQTGKFYIFTNSCSYLN